MTCVTLTLTLFYQRHVWNLLTLYHHETFSLCSTSVLPSEPLARDWCYILSEDTTSRREH